MGVCNCSMFCCALLYVHSSIAIILMGKRELIALLNLSSWCLVMVERLFITVPQGCLQFVLVVFPDHTHYFCSELHRFIFSGLQKWSKGKVRDKLNNLVLFDKATYDKLYKEVPSYKLITPSVVSERLKVRGSLAKAGLRELHAKSKY